MKILEVDIKNFLAIKHIHLQLDRPGLNLVLGKNLDDKRYDSNGVAKTATFESIIYALYGKLLRDISIEKAVRNGQKELQVSVIIDPEDGNVPVTITRIKNIKGSSVSCVTKEGIQLFPSNSVKDIQSYIDEWLGIDYKTFVNSVFFGKGLTKFFMSANDSERKDLLDTILQIVSFEEPLENAKNQTKEFQSQLINLESDLKVSIAFKEDKENLLNISNKEYEEFSVVASTKKKELQRSLSLFIEQKSKLDEEYKELTKQQKTIDYELQEKLNSLQIEFNNKVEELEKEKTAVYQNINEQKEEKLQNITKKFKDLIEEKLALSLSLKDKIKQKNILKFELDLSIRTLEIELEKIQKEKECIDVLHQGDVCITCRQIIDEKHLSELKLRDTLNIKGFKDLLEQKAKEKHLLEETELSVLLIEKDSIEQELKDINVLLEEQKKKVEQTFFQLKFNAQTKFSNILDTYKSELSESKYKFSETFSKLSDGIKKNIGDIKTKLVSLEYKNKLVEQELLILSDKDASLVSSISKLEEDIKQLNKNIITYNERKEVYSKKFEFSQFWVEAFGPRGIKSFIFENALPYLTERANYYSTFLTGGTVVIEILPVTTAKIGTTKEKLFVSAKNSLGADIYNGNSDGEKRRIDICILLAIQDLMTTRAKKIWNTVIFDEVMDTLDRTGIEHVIDLFRTTLKDKSVYVISHSSDLKQFFDDSITIKKHKGVASLDV